MSDSSGDELALQTVDSVELRLARAGVGARSYAFIIDWHIRLLAALVWAGAVTAAVWLRPVLFPVSRWPVLMLPAVIVYLGYHPLLETLQRGTTPGKRMAGLRIVGDDGGPPTTAALLLRNLFRLVDMLPGFYALGLTVMLVSRHQTRIGDLAAGTAVVFDPALGRGRGHRALLHLADAHAAPQILLLADELIARWGELQPAGRTEMARRLLERSGRTPASEPSALVAQLKALREPAP
jgi:uncharacterized RDD family membrane protein YckC